MSALAIQGASSSAGKSLLTTALGRALRRRGIDVVPFKAQNMSNNARVVDGGEIGTAQYLQALAAGVEPEVRMNPVLVKPEGDDRSQVVVLGRPDIELSRMAWRSRRERLWEAVEPALRGLLAEHELVLIEGAGTPAEINLRDTDLANMRTAKLAGAPVLLVADIDRGGAFAHLYGTWALLPEDERSRIAGFVLNKFRGDRSLLPPGPQRLEELTGVPTLGVLPWLDHGLPDEDGAAMPGRVEGGRSVAVVRYPTASNLDEFKALEQVADVRWAGSAAELDGADLLILPGSKHVAADLAWLARSGLAAAVRDRVAAGLPVLGICGGMQMLGERIEDPAGVDGSAQGLGLLPIATTFAREKRTEKIATRFRVLAEPWAALSKKPLSGYEIRHGQSDATAPVAEALPDGLGFAKRSVLGVYPHGLFEQPELLAALFGAAPARSLERAFEGLADAVEEHIDLDALLRGGGIG
jgi:adenosylcobyric acid synthase